MAQCDLCRAEIPAEGLCLRCRNRQVPEVRSRLRRMLGELGRLPTATTSSPEEPEAEEEAGRLVPFRRPRE